MNERIGDRPADLRLPRAASACDPCASATRSSSTSSPDGGSFRSPRCSSSFGSHGLSCCKPVSRTVAVPVRSGIGLALLRRQVEVGCSKYFCLHKTRKRFIAAPAAVRPPAAISRNAVSTKWVFGDAFMGDLILRTNRPAGKQFSARGTNAANGSISAHSCSLFDRERSMPAAARSRRADILLSCINDELLEQFDLSRRTSPGLPQTPASPLRPTALAHVRADRF